MGGIAQHQGWQKTFLSWKAQEKKFVPSQKARVPKVDWRRQMERGTLHYGRPYEGPNESDYRPGNSFDRLQNVGAPFSDADGRNANNIALLILLKLVMESW